MPQEYHVIKCFKCELFQVDIPKKIKKWTCKVCGEKQSLMQEFGNGTSKVCRDIVQRLNTKTSERGIDNKISNFSKIEIEKDLDNTFSKKSKWNKFEPMTNICTDSENFPGYFDTNLKCDKLVERHSLCNFQDSPFNKLKSNELKNIDEIKLRLENKIIQGVGSSDNRNNTNPNNLTENFQKKTEKFCPYTPLNSSTVQVGTISSSTEHSAVKYSQKRLSAFGRHNRKINLNNELNDLPNKVANNVKKSKWEDFV